MPPTASSCPSRAQSDASAVSGWSAARADAASGGGGSGAQTNSTAGGGPHYALHVSPGDGPMATERSGGGGAKEYGDSAMSSPSSAAVPLAVDRRVYNQYRFDREFGYVERSDRAWSAGRYLRNAFTCSRRRALRTLVGFVPILDWLPNYKWRSDLAADGIAGITVGIMHIPQGMAYASLAGLEPVYGLYTSFFPTLFYMFFGTSRHVSLGVFAVVSLMVGQVRMRLIPDTPLDHGGTSTAAAAASATTAGSYFTTDTTAAVVSDTSTAMAGLQSDYTAIEVVTALTLAVALIQLAMGLLRLGFITAYLSDQVVQGFTTGAACHVFTAQINKILNVHLPRHSGPGALFKVYYDLYHSLPKASWASIIVSVISMAFLIVGKEIINPPVKKRIHLPIPFELILVIAGTAISYLLDFHKRYDMLVVDYIPNGLPPPRLPPLEVIPDVLGDAFGIAIVAFVVTVSLGKLFAKKHHYKIDPTQELYALGIMNGLCSLVRCYPASTALARSLVYEAAGCRTQFASVFTCTLLFIVLMWMGPLFQALPMCILSSIIVVALKGMFVQLGELARLWPVSKIDFLIWLVSFVATVTLDVREGLIVSVAFALLTTVFRAQRAPTVLLGRIPRTDIYKDIVRYRRIEHVPNVRVYRFDAPLMFVNSELFRSDCYDECGVRLADARRALADFELQRHKASVNNVGGDPAMEPLNDTAAAVVVPPGAGPAPEADDEHSAKRAAMHHLRLPDFVLLDCSSFNYIDYMGVQTLWQVYEELTEIGVTVLFASFKGPARDMLDTSPFYEHVPKRALYPTVHDAVTFAQARAHAMNLRSAPRSISGQQRLDDATQHSESELAVIASY